ncbi:hypothetical protein ID866_3279, partial [Astraeus odoratus]
MPHSLISSAGAVVNRLSPDDDEDNDICPVCDGDCTCNNRPHPLPAPVASSGDARYAATATASTTSSGRVPAAPPLKIKLTVPPSMQNKVRSSAAPPKKCRADGQSVSSSGGVGSSSVPSYSSPGQSHLPDTSSTAGRGYQQVSDLSAPKRRGRPSRSTASPRQLSKFSDSDRLKQGNEAATLPQSQSRLPSQTPRLKAPKNSHSLAKGSTQQKSNIKASRQAPKPRTKGTITKEAVSIKKHTYVSDAESDFDSNDQSVLDEDEEDNDTCPGRFPTFLPADELMSTASESSESDSESVGFGSDSSLEAEEDSYILAEQKRHEKARVRRELLGDDGFRRKDSHNNWVIRPRKRSVGLSDVEMDGDTDEVTDEDDDDEDEQMDEDEEEDETDGQMSQSMYTGVATGWSDDEESSFDADLFFANLSDTSSEGSLSDEDTPQISDAGNDAITASISSLPRSVDFEVTEAWDGQLVFTNGANDGHGVLDIAFEATAAQLLA